MQICDKRWSWGSAPATLAWIRRLLPSVALGGLMVSGLPLISSGQSFPPGTASQPKPTAPRAWDLGGRSTLARYLGHQGDQIQLRREGVPTVLLVPLDQLSSADFQYVLITELRSHGTRIPPGRIEAQVVKVADGDSFTVLLDSKQTDVRLHGVDAPEYGQPFFGQAATVLRGWIDGKRIQLETLATDKYGRRVCRAWLDGQSINAALVSTGCAWHYAAFNDDPVLARLERQAQARRVGLWADVDPQPPWEWRQASQARER